MKDKTLLFMKKNVWLTKIISLTIYFVIELFLTVALLISILYSYLKNIFKIGTSRVVENVFFEKISYELLKFNHFLKIDKKRQ